MAISGKNGTALETPAAETIPVHNPVTGEQIGSVPQSTPGQVAAAVARARRAAAGWAALSVTARLHTLRRFADLLWERQDDMIRIIRRETGKPDGMALNEIIALDAHLTFWVNHAAGILHDQTRRAIVPVVHRASVHYRPHGVVGIISPWNFPFLLPFLDALPALVAGNTVVLKPSEVTPYSSELGISLLHEAGLPRDVMQIVHGDGRAGAALVEEVDYVAFTGSQAVGRKIAARAGERLIPYSLELGGKNPLLLLDDAPLDEAVTAMIRTAFANAGQVCMSVGRAYVEATIYDRVIERLYHWMPQYRVGTAGSDHMGSLTNERELLRVEAHLEDAVARGAKILTGGRRRPDLGPLFYEPTILVDVDHSMRVMREETFGPLLPIMKVANVEEAIQYANDSDCGLTASVFTRDLKRGAALARRLEAGDVTVNVGLMVIATPALPSGGLKSSGIGRRNGKEGLLRFVAPQGLVVNTGLAQVPTLDLVDSRTLLTAKLMRQVRRYLPFV
ncbi:MAG: succinic semialdehyde dehydrogenase [Anaerolineae bacterium]|jgi:acyl-CoA reductase-like NAD-dependent aldehyde dehydrogenase|nr:succinic semialdehyde dehydrogenase [Anaerolineae bacterium]